MQKKTACDVRSIDWSSDVCSSDLQHLRRVGKRAHGMDDAEHRGDDAEARHGVGQGAQGARYLVRFVMVGFQLLVDQRFQLVRILGAERHHAQIVAQELEHVMVLGDRGELREEAAFVGFRSEEHTSELQSLMRISYAVFCLKKKKKSTQNKSI